MAGLASEERTVVLFESPHRLEASLADLLEVLGDRYVAIARELTKLHEEVRRGPLSKILEGLKADPARGEVVVVIEGAKQSPEDVPAEELASSARRLMASGVERKTALASVAKSAGVSKKKVFDALIDEP
jgi:16S rRNA (cytidine1402-2'-O)-methyltransferase